MSDKKLVKLERQLFLAALKIVAMASARKSVVPSCRMVHIERADEILTLTCTNLNTSLSYRLSCEDGDDFGLLLPVKDLIDVLNVAHCTDVSLYSSTSTAYGMKSHTAQLKCDATFFSMAGLPPDDFPPIDHTERLQVNVSGGAFARAIKRVSVAMSLDESRPVLNGCLLKFTDDGSLCVTASDGKRLHLELIDHDAKGEGDRDLIIPADCVALLVKLLDDNFDGKLKIGVAARNCSFYGPSFQIITKLIDLKYPNVSQVIPSTSNKKLWGSKEDIIQALRSTSVAGLADKSTHIVTGSSGCIKFLSHSEGFLAAETQTEIKSPEKDFKLAVNSDYVLDALAGLSDDNVTIEVSEEFSPIVVKESTFMAVVMPMIKEQPDMPPPPPEDTDDGMNELLTQAIEIIRETERASLAMIERRLKLGHAKARLLMDMLEEKGVVGPPKGNGQAREVLLEG